MIAMGPVHDLQYYHWFYRSDIYLRPNISCCNAPSLQPPSPLCIADNVSCTRRLFGSLGVDGTNMKDLGSWIQPWEREALPILLKGSASYITLNAIQSGINQIFNNTQPTRLQLPAMGNGDILPLSQW